MSDQQKIERLRTALAGAVGAVQALADIASKQGNPKTAEAALQLAATYLKTIKDTEP